VKVFLLEITSRLLITVKKLFALPKTTKFIQSLSQLKGLATWL
jgi:hypothetical protein